MNANLRLSVIATALALLNMSGGAVGERLSDDGGSWFQGAVAQEGTAHDSGGHESGGGSAGGGSSGGHESGGGSSGGHESGGGSSGGHESGGGSSGGHESGGGCSGGCSGGSEGGGNKYGTEEKGHGLKMHHEGHESGVHQSGGHGEAGQEQGQHQYMGPRSFAGGTGSALHAAVPEGLGRYGEGAPNDRGRLRYWGGWTFPEDPPVIPPDGPPVVPPDEPPVVPPVVPPPAVTPDDPPVVPPPVVSPDQPPVAPPPAASTDPTDTTDHTEHADTTDGGPPADTGRSGAGAPGDDVGRYGDRGEKALDPSALTSSDTVPEGAGPGPSLSARGILPSEERCDDVGGAMTTAQRYSDQNLRRISAAHAQLDPTVRSPLGSRGAPLLADFQEELEKPSPDLAAAGVYVGLLAKMPVTPEKVISVCAHLCVPVSDTQAAQIANTAELQRTTSK